MIVILHPDEKIKYISILEFLWGFGDGFGPILGSILYSIFGYFAMFLVLGSVTFVFILIIKATLPSDIDSKESTVKLNDSNSQSNAEAIQKISYKGMLWDHTILVMWGANLFSSWAFTYYEPILSFRLLDFTTSVYIQSLVFFCLTGGYAFMAIFVTCFTKYFKPLNIVAWSLFMTGIFNFMVGPSILLPDNLILMAVGLFCTGMSLVFSGVLQVPIMLKRAEVKFPSQSRLASDYCWSIYNFVYSVGMFLGPIYGGHMAELVGYRACWDIISIIMICYSFIFYFTLKLCSKTETWEKVQSLQILRRQKSMNSRSGYYTGQNLIKAT